ncbi:hypothetical protein [Cellulosimicrobium composti]|uniref:FHA domain-containing protein n=1 Tax=Cellulosimicrobium composti TaxID=2672572 RepID=A0ABX0B6X9_9MICO|nr:hypothetical protein [Cellulosimicrobium composti]NDO88499.1 hypothetical protein [Cellulosimicrobium composti]
MTSGRREAKMAQGGWSATAVLQVGDVVSERWLIDTESEVTIGRSPRAGLRSPSENGHVPRELARLKHFPIGWMLANSGNTVGGTKAPVRVRGPYIENAEGAEFAPNSMIILQKGEWTLEWDLPIRTVLTLTPLSESSDTVDLAVARDRAHGTSGNQTLRASPVSLTPVQRTRMAALFAYLIRDGSPPENRYRAAADLLGESVEQVKSTARRFSARSTTTHSGSTRQRSTGSTSSEGTWSGSREPSAKTISKTPAETRHRPSSSRATPMTTLRTDGACPRRKPVESLAVDTMIVQPWKDVS